jgi:dienelactone hydrolase
MTIHGDSAAPQLPDSSHPRRIAFWIFGTLLALALTPASTPAAESSQAPAAESRPLPLDTAKMLREYFEQMSVAKPFGVRTGGDWETHRRNLRDFVLDCAGLKPLPQRVPLDVHESETLDHPWCTVRRVSYQLWPGVYSAGLLYLPKQLPERPAPAMLCPHGHWEHGHAHPEVQKRCLNLARLGYVTFSSAQNHYEDLSVGVSHQTLMIWNNIRALDYLESLTDVDKTRIGVAGASGGGLQTQMLAALDERVQAATIVGLTCDFRQIMFPDASHCACNHFPGVMQRTDHPEISALGLPAAVQYLTMNDWTRGFESANFPTVRDLYAAHGRSDRVFCRYFDTEHNYDRTKREWTYWWMERWLRGQAAPEPAAEPETQTFPVETLTKLSAAVAGDKGFAEIGRLYRAQRSVPVPPLSSRDDWQAYRQQMLGTLRNLLGEGATLARQVTAIRGSTKTEDRVVVEYVAYPSEGPILVPAIVLRPQGAPAAKLPVIVMLGAGGKESLLAETGSESPRGLAQRGSLVVLPDPRTYGELFSTGSKNASSQKQAWERNGIVWGRPVPGLAATDLRGVLDGIAERVDSDPNRVTVLTRGSGDLAIAALFAMILDARVSAADLDFAGASFGQRNLALVPRVLLYGDVLQWAALVADRQLRLRNVPPAAGDVAWLEQAFAAAGNSAGLERIP